MKTRPKSQMTAAQRQKLTDAENEQGRRKAMSSWYAAMEVHLWGLMSEPGFPAHKSEDEKLEHIVATFLTLSAKIIAADRDTDVDEQVKAFEGLCRTERELLVKQEAARDHTMMAAIVAGLIRDPAMAKQPGLPPIGELLEEPWKGCAECLTAENAEDREKMAFAHLVPFPESPAGHTATLLRGKMKNIGEFTLEANMEGFREAAAALMKRDPGSSSGRTAGSEPADGGSSPSPGAEEPSNVVSLVDPSGRELRSDLEETATELESAIATAESVVGPEAG